MDLSIIIPVFNEKENIADTHSRLTQVLSRADCSYELIFVDDGSQDGSLEELKSIRSGDDCCRIVQLSRNFGQHPALAAGFSAACGKILVTIDADLQIDPEHIIPLTQMIAQGYDFVGGIRVGNGDSFFKRRLPSRITNAIIGRAVGRRMKDYGCPLNAMTAQVAKKMHDYGDMQRFFKPLAVTLCESERVGEIEVAYQHRNGGSSKYNFLRLVDLFFDFVTNFSKQIFQKVALAGLGLAGISFFSGTLYLLMRFVVGWLHEPYDRLLVLILLGLIFGMNLLVLGILGDFIIRIFKKIDQAPLYKIEKIW